MLPFAWSDDPIRSDALRARVERLGDDFPDGYTTEVNLNYGRWIRSVGRRFQQGILLVFDYGFSRDDLYHADRTEGTLQTYLGHTSGVDPLAHAGRCDITSHVDFTELAERALEEGFDVLGFLDQNHFLMGIGEPWLMELERAGIGGAEADAVTSERSSLLRQFQTLTHPGIMGRDFKVLVLGKLVPAKIAKTLSCLRYARPPMPQLGIV
jgi:SAM-dependent MidA family methyltransferase